MAEEGYGEQGYTMPGREHYTPTREGRRFYMLAFIIGGGLGAMASMLLVPRAGRESRDRMKELSLKMKEKAGVYCEGALEKVAVAIDKGMELLHDGKPLIKTVIDAGMRAYDRDRRQKGGPLSGGPIE